MQAQMSLGLWELLFWVFAGSGLLGMPPGDRDPVLMKSVPPQTLVYFEWASRGAGQAGATGIDGFMADPEVRQFFQLMDAALEKREIPSFDNEEESESVREFRKFAPQLVKLIATHPGCLFAGFEPPLPNKPGVAGWLNLLAGVHGGAILSSGSDTETLWKALQQVLSSIPDSKYDEANSILTIPLQLPGYSVVMHREDQRIIFAIGNGTLSRIVEGLAGRLPGLDTNPRFRRALERVSVPRVATVGWIDGKGIVASVTDALGPVGMLIRPMLTILGADAIDHIVQTSGVDHEIMFQRTFVGTGGRTDGLMVLAGGNPIQPEHFAHVPADADLVLATSISLSRVFQESRQLLAKTQPLSVRVFDEAVKQLEKELELKIVEDVLPAFGDVFLAFDSPSAGGMIASSLVVSLNIRDVGKAQRVFERLMTFVSQSISSEHSEQVDGEMTSLLHQEFMGRTIYYVHTLGGAFSGHIAMTPCFCLTDRHLLFAVHPQAMKAHLRDLQSKRPRFDPQVSLKGKPIAGDPLTFVYVNGPRANNIVGALLPYLSQTLLGRLQEEGVSLDAFCIPSAAAISPYFGDTTAIVARQRDGLFIEAQNAPPVMVALAILSTYRTLTAPDYEMLDVVRRQRANRGEQAKLGPAEGDVKLANSTQPAKPDAKASPSPYRKLAPLFIKAMIPDSVQQLIPESAYRKIEEGPSPEMIQRREEARQKREERRKRRLEQQK